MLPVVLAALLGASPASAAERPHPFNVHDLVMMDRVGSPVLSPDGKTVAFTVRETDYDANKGVTGIWTVPLAGGTPTRLTGPAISASGPAWSADGGFLYFTAANDGVNQLWRVAATGGAAAPVSAFAVDVNSFRLSPDGEHVLVSIDVFPECTAQNDALACTRARLDARAAEKTSGRVYDRLFVRHWDSWADGRRSQLFLADLDAQGRPGTLHHLSRGLDGDIPSKPFGDAGEYAFSPDGGTVYFDVRIAGATEAWSTNFDIYSVPTHGPYQPVNLTSGNPAWDGFPLPAADGKTLYYLAMERPGFESDRFAIRALDLASGESREIAPQWDRSASPPVASADGKTLYTAADDHGAHALFAIDVASGQARKLVGEGTVAGFDAGGAGLVVAHQDWQHPTDLYRADAGDGRRTRITQFNVQRLADIAFGDGEFFTFEGAAGDTVQGYVVRPVGYEPGRKYPVAFLIHGGPQGAFNSDFHYRWNPQTYAGQGFAVVSINFHGSTGYGQKFTDAISGDWGGAPLEDLKLGWAAALDRYDFLDADRACALGASYGGYMAYWIAGVWNEPWKCIVSHDGVFDTRMMGYATEELWFTERENGGTPYQRPEAYERFNPVNHVKDWRVPMLVIHNALDYRIPIGQGIAAFTALQRRGIPSRFLTFPDENHWVLKPHNSVQWHDTVNAWLKQWTAARAGE